MSKICDQCNFTNEDNSTFCVNCGAQLAGDQVFCTQCGAAIAPTDERCPQCGAVNDNFKRAQNLTPKTIEELKQWYAARNLPPEEKTRFFIGKDYRGAKAFGIYQDAGGDFVVYKNKSDGSRAVRYKGRDEAYAVNEIYTKLRETIQTQKTRPGYGSGSRSSSGTSSAKSKKKGGLAAFLSHPIVVFILIVLALMLLKGCASGACSACDACGTACVVCSTTDCSTSRGYYTGGGRTYYYDHGTWFLYNALSDTWSKSYSSPSDYDSYDYSSYSPSGISSATSSSVYQTESSSWSSGSSSGWSWDDFWSSDSDYDWDSGSSWDFDWGGSWDSDW